MNLNFFKNEILQLSLYIIILGIFGLSIVYHIPLKYKWAFITPGEYMVGVNGAYNEKVTENPFPIPRKAIFWLIALTAIGLSLSDFEPGVSYFKNMNKVWSVDSSMIYNLIFFAGLVFLGRGNYLGAIVFIFHFVSAVLAYNNQIVVSGKRCAYLGTVHVVAMIITLGIGGYYYYRKNKASMSASLPSDV